MSRIIFPKQKPSAGLCDFVIGWRNDKGTSLKASGEKFSQKFVDEMVLLTIEEIARIKSLKATTPQSQVNESNEQK
jgi:hypothetical protein